MPPLLCRLLDDLAGIFLPDHLINQERWNFKVLCRFDIHSAEQIIVRFIAHIEQSIDRHINVPSSPSHINRSFGVVMMRSITIIGITDIMGLLEIK